MSRTGVERKVPWREVPASVRSAIEELLGSSVSRATRVWGGYAPTPTFRLRLSDGRQAFVKGIHPALVDGALAALPREMRVYEELGQFIGRWAPKYFGSAEADGWKFIALEDLGPKSAPPWTRRLARDLLHDYAAFHESTLASDLPAWLTRPGDWVSKHGRFWDWVSDNLAVSSVAALAGPKSSEAVAWIENSADRLVSSVSGLLDSATPWGLLHNDTRSDNLRWVGERLVLLDWPHVAVGPVEMDLVGFVQSITLEGGPEPEELLEWYEERLRLNPKTLDASTAAMAGFFAYQAGQPEIPELPRLRLFQRQQLRITLSWAARRLGLPFPRWLERLEV